MQKDDGKVRYEQVGEVVRIFQRAKKWYANFQLAGKQQRKSLNTSSKKEARRRAIQMEAEILQGRYQPAVAPPAIAAVVADYMQSLRTERRAAKTLTKYQGVFDRLTAFAADRGNTTLDTVNLKSLDAYRAQRVNAGAAAKTVYVESVVVRQLVNFALSRGMLSADPLRGLRLKKPKPTPQPCWTPEEVENILQASVRR